MSSVIVSGSLMLVALGAGLLLGILINKLGRKSHYEIIQSGILGRVIVLYKGRSISDGVSMEEATKIVELHKQIVK